MSFTILTNIGRNKEAAALAAGTPMSITHMAWGDGDRIPAGGETALQNEVGRKTVMAKGVDKDSLNTVFFEILLAEDEGPFTVREVGLFDSDGDMIAIAKYDPAVNKPLNHVSVTLRINVVFSNLENLIIQVDPSKSFVPASREIVAGHGLSGGGDLSQDRELAVDFATKEEAENGASASKVMSPNRVKEAITALSGAGGAGLISTDLDAISGSGFYDYQSSAIGNPLDLTDGRLLHMQAPNGERSQIAVNSAHDVFVRDQDAGNGTWSDWSQFFLHRDITFKDYATNNASDGWLIGENFKGDTSVGLGYLGGTCYRVGNLAHISIRLDFNNFSIPASNDSAIETRFNLGAMGRTAQWFQNILTTNVGVAYGRLSGSGWDAPWMTLFCSVDPMDAPYGNTLFLSTRDTYQLPTQATPAENLTVHVCITGEVGD